MNNSAKHASASFRAERYQVSGYPSTQKGARRDFYKIWLLENGGTIHHGDFIADIKAPSLVFLHPLTPYQFSSSFNSRSGYWAIFDIDFIFNINLPSSSIFLPDEASIVPLKRNAYQKNVMLFQGIVDDYHSEYMHRYDSIGSAIHLLIHEGLKHRPAPAKKLSNDSASQRLASKFLTLLEKQFPITSSQEPLSIRKPAAFADQLAVHVNHLNAVVRQVTGKSTSAHIADRMIKESKALLQFTDWMIADIAYALGFEYSNHFTAFFKKHTRQIPMALRR